VKKGEDTDLRPIEPEPTPQRRPRRRWASGCDTDVGEEKTPPTARLRPPVSSAIRGNYRRGDCIPPSIEGDRAGDGFTADEAGIEDEGEVREPQRAASPFVLSRC
jgi:hypothetical protein